MFHHSKNLPRGLTLVELMIAMTIMVLVVGTLASLSKGIQVGYEYNETTGLATQHARVALDRISRMVAESTANDQFPGVLVLADTIGTCQFPDTLVVWHPSGTAADPSGLPRYQELVIYCPQWNAPNRLVELTVPTDTRTVPAVDQTTTWQTQITAIRQASTTKCTLMTDLVRTCTAVSGSTGGGTLRAAIRFAARLRPSAADLAAYKAGTTSWNALPWVQGLYGSQYGLRQTWVRTELQLMPGTSWSASNTNGRQPLPFLGSATRYYQLHK